MEQIGGELEALQGMFPAWDVHLLADILEAHQGDMESTVDLLLTMDTAPRNAMERATLPPAPAQTSPRSPRQQRKTSPSSSPKSQRHRVKLPDDFLQLPIGEFGSLSEQEERDAVLARMMQDEIFRDEILSSEEFSSHFHDRSAGQEHEYPPEKTATEIATETYNAMSEKLTNMSEVMKTKMHEMYMRFQMRNDAPASRDPKSEDEDLSDNSDMRRRNVDQRRSQASPRRENSNSVTRRSGVSKKND
ncbi:hypothetical protein BBO99_00001500 [Phytophthora kernoviae]|uniref:CUE domain-containing protein n=2 Tax=Phytophthora kernoviae TaxID=325452 RepID=A0A3R7JB38_9STRA|nr:hypothetical protein G195_005386 [Phytophthora kernoviae 00238/432]KAG2526712.1 hypothetical protein JM18_004262 [Phytophthora kernoviae]KAG2531350.1 hypothetical protein JM16_001118 [Phytophthora kernoviae]RLN20306.1 hypothetical protein BBI17_001323 [Phytophthora kernoviae]RLN84189.1 hypothetical protein BBO99_00001500 [Phytophthora kernoviae]